jgi:hypothetical protein
MRRLPLVIACASLAVLAACSDNSPTSAPTAPEDGSSQLAPPNSRSHGLPIVRTARRHRIDPQKIRDRIRFNIEFRYLVPPTASAEAAFDLARDKWQGIIIKDVEAVEGLLPQSLCTGGPDFEGTIDDVLIDVLLIPIDGPGNILGAAGPCFVRTSDNLPVSGVMIFDTEDLAFLESYELLDEVIVHEMGHVLGFGTIWDYERTLLAGAGTGSPTFTGRLANVFYKALGGRGALPVEGEYGPGTADSHWDEETFDNELMTGFLNLGENPLSVITAASMRDLGYGAIPIGEKYRLPAPAGAAALRTQGEGIPIAKQEQLYTPKAAVE